MSDNEKRAKLIKAIRALTVDLPYGEPNGRTEKEILALEKAIGKTTSSAARRHFGNMCDSMANDIRDLRIAAEEFFGENMKDP